MILFRRGAKNNTLKGVRLVVLLVFVLAALLAVRAVDAAPLAQGATPTPPSPVQAQIAVERAVVFPVPDRNAEALTYLYERERVPVLAQHADGVFLLTVVGGEYGWILRAQVDLEGDLALVPVVTSPGDLPNATPSATFTPFQLPTQAAGTPAVTPLAFATRTPSATQTSGPGASAAVTPLALTPGADEADTMQVFPGVPPPLDITLPEDWEAVDLVVPMRTFDNEVRDLPLTIYFGPLAPDVTGLIYLYWGFPNTVDRVTGEYNLWADGAQILRGSLVGQTCTLGVYEQQNYPVGEREGIGANYQTSNCTEEADTAGWFAVLRVGSGTYAFFTAVEPWNALPDYRDDLQAILDTVTFEIAGEQTP